MAWQWKQAKWTSNIIWRGSWVTNFVINKTTEFSLFARPKNRKKNALSIFFLEFETSKSVKIHFRLGTVPRKMEDWGKQGSDANSERLECFPFAGL